MTCSSFASRARNKITIQSTSSTDDGLGGRETSFSTQSQPWAILESKAIREIIAGGIETRVAHTATIRYQTALSNGADISSYRVSFDDRLFGIKGVVNLAEDMKTEGRAYQRLLLEENGPDTNG